MAVADETSSLSIRTFMEPAAGRLYFFFFLKRPSKKTGINLTNGDHFTFYLLIR